MTNYEELLEKEEQTLQTAREIQRLLNDVNNGYSQALEALGSLKGEIEGKLEDFNNKKQTLEQNMVSSSEALKLFYQKIEEITPKIEEVKTIYGAIKEKKEEIDTIYQHILQIEQSVKEVKQLIDRAVEILDLPNFVIQATAKRDEILNGLTNDINTLLEQQKAIYRDILNQLNTAAENAISEISSAGGKMNSIRDSAIASVNEAKSNASREITSLKDTSLQAIQELKDESIQAMENKKISSVKAVKDAEDHAIMEINKLVPTEPELIDAYTIKTISENAISGYLSEAKQQVKVNKFWIPEEHGDFLITFSSLGDDNDRWFSSIPLGKPYNLGSGDFCSLGLTTYLIKQGNTVSGKCKTSPVSKTFETPIKKIRSTTGTSFVLLENGEVYIVGYLKGVVSSSFQLFETGVVDIETSGEEVCLVTPTSYTYSNRKEFYPTKKEATFTETPAVFTIQYQYGMRGFVIKDGNRAFSTQSGRFMTGFKSVGIGFGGYISFELENGNIGVCNGSALLDVENRFTSHSETFWGLSIIKGKLRGSYYKISFDVSLNSFDADNVKEAKMTLGRVSILNVPSSPSGTEIKKSIN